VNQYSSVEYGNPQMKQELEYLTDIVLESNTFRLEEDQDESKIRQRVDRFGETNEEGYSAFDGYLLDHVGTNGELLVGYESTFDRIKVLTHKQGLDSGFEASNGDFASQMEKAYVAIADDFDYIEAATALSPFRAILPQELGKEEVRKLVGELEEATEQKDSLHEDLYSVVKDHQSIK